MELCEATEPGPDRKSGWPAATRCWSGWLIPRRAPWRYSGSRTVTVLHEEHALEGGSSIAWVCAAASRVLADLTVQGFLLTVYEKVSPKMGGWGSF